MDCPKCGAVGVTSDECPKCGVFISKYVAAEARKKEEYESKRLAEQEADLKAAEQIRVQLEVQAAQQRLAAAATRDCPYCYSKIDARATVCPQCRKSSVAPSTLSGCGVLVLGVIFVIFLGSMLGDCSTSPTTNTTTYAQTTKSTNTLVSKPKSIPTREYVKSGFVGDHLYDEYRWPKGSHDFKFIDPLDPHLDNAEMKVIIKALAREAFDINNIEDENIIIKRDRYGFGSSYIDNPSVKLAIVPSKWESDKIKELTVYN